MKKIFYLLLMMLLIACGKKEEISKINTNYTFEDITEKSKDTTVNIYMWGGQSEVNKFIDGFVAKKLKTENNIILNRIPITDIRDAVNKLIVEKQAGKKNGSVDILWVNGENFKSLKNADVLWGDFVANLPNRNLLKESTLITDFGEEINGLEAPFGEAQFNFIYKSSTGDIPFTDLKTLKDYVKKNPGKFTYAPVSDFEGSAFVRNIAIEYIGKDRIIELSNEELEKELNGVWEFFRDIKPYLWREGATYPTTQGNLDNLYKNGEVDVTMGYTINKVATKVAKGDYPKDSKSFLLNNGTLFNNHYLTIPANASNKAGAVYVINHLLSEEVQLQKQDPNNWGDFTVLSMDKVSNETKVQFENLRKSDILPSVEEIEEKRIREISPEKLEIIEKGWLENIGKN